MTNLEAFLEAVIDEDHQLYGYTLKPMTLWHLSMLEQFAPSAMGKQPSPKDLRVAACICASRDMKQFRKLSKGWRAWRANFYTYKTQVSVWVAYLSDHLTFPEANETDGVTDNPFPTALMFGGRLIKETGYDFEKVLYDMPIGQIYWLVMTLIYLEKGETALMSDKERAVRALIEGKAELVTGQG